MPTPALPSEQCRQHRSRAQTERTERVFEISVSYLLLFAFLSLFGRLCCFVTEEDLMESVGCSSCGVSSCTVKTMYGIRLDAMRIDIH